MATAQITVYLQALDGHFLGPHAYQTDNILINLHYSGGVVNLPYVLNPDSNDGTPSTTFASGSSTFMPIITVPSTGQPDTLVNFLSPENTAVTKTIAGQATIQLLDQIEMAQLDISIPTTLGESFCIKQNAILNPDQSTYKIIIVVPGLYLAPSTIPGALSVYVRMMCGCPITPGATASLWPDDDFIVTANVLDTSGASTTYTLTYDTTQPGNSLFSIPLSPGQKPIESVRFTASQKSTVNYGVLMQEYQSDIS